MEHDINCAFRRFEEAPLPRTARGGSQRFVLFKFSAPASQRQEVTHPIWSDCLIREFPGSHLFVGMISRPFSTCPAGSSSVRAPLHAHGGGV